MAVLRRWLFIAGLIFILPCSVFSAESNCFDCHEKMSFSGKVVHKPLTEGKCTACHNPHVAHFKGLLDQQGADLCYSCHLEEKKQFVQGKVHAPVRRGECLVCHAPHAASASGLVRDNLSGICLSCHKNLSAKYTFSHAPYATGKCSACHDPHHSANGQLLKDENDATCFTCHKEQNFSQVHKNYPGKPGKCLTCHNPHGSKRKGLIRDVLHPPYATGCNECHDGNVTGGGSENCMRCHESVKNKMFNVHSHIGGASPNTCVNCHSPHAADAKGMLKSSQQQVCHSCHQDTRIRYEDKLFKHAGAEKCTECHEPHGSDRLIMLKADGNAICTRCHETQGQFTHPVGENVRDPRTDQPLSCISCHTPMGSDYKYELILSGAKDLCVQCHKKY